MFMHYAFDAWMVREFPDVPFERYCDDIIVHARSERQALQCGPWSLRGWRNAGSSSTSRRPASCTARTTTGAARMSTRRSTFLGYTFRPRLSKNRFGKHFLNFSPAVSNDAKTAMRHEMRRWRLHLRSDKTLTDLARMFNVVLQGWINYYGRFYKSMLYPVFRHLNEILVRWAMRKYKRLRRHKTRASRFLADVARRQPGLFAHWRFGVRPDGWTMGAR